MRLSWRRNKPSSEPKLEVLGSPVPVKTWGVAPFGGDLEDFTVLRYHAIRALCGVLMDRHTACRSPHPFCGPSHQRDGDAPKLKPRWDVHLSGDDDQLGCVGESLSSVLGE